MKITTKRQKYFTNDIMLQIDGRTLQSIERKRDRFGTYYKSDTFGKTYNTITEAKKHTLELYIDGYFNRK